jgi:hypothetical protein
MESILNYLPVMILILTAITAIFEKTRKSKRLTWIIIVMIVLSLVSQIVLNIFNNEVELKKENQAKVEEERLNKKSDSLTNVIIFKEDGIREFIETYLLRDSILKSKYDSINKFFTEKDRPILNLYNVFLRKDTNDFYYLSFKIKNDGVQPATGINGKEWIITNINNNLFNQGFVNLSISGSAILPKGDEFEVFKTSAIELKKVDFTAPIYFYYYFTYKNLIAPSKIYIYKIAFKTHINNYNQDSMAISLCKPWEESNLEKLLGIK